MDRGGTFTDVIGIDPGGNLHVSKLPSVSPRYPDPAIEGIRRMLALPGEEPIPESLVGGIRMGTTVATNALLERKGTPVALFVTKGFRDMLEIGYQNRPELFRLSIRKPRQLYSCVGEVDERVDSRGRIATPIDLEALREDLLVIWRRGVRSIAFALMHSWKNGIHEEKAGDLARGLGFSHVSLSHEIMPLIKVVGRGQTCVVDAYLGPVLRKYIESVERFTGNIPLEFMQSSGGITGAGTFGGKDAVISGPAGGVIGMAAVTDLDGIDEAIGIDMGGTSTDVSRYGGKVDRVFEVTTGGIQFQTSSLDIKTVAAGGGSKLWFDGQRMRVGPESVGSDPGPVCYGRSGELALTDANLLLGRIRPGYFPRVFGHSQESPLDVSLTRKKFEEITRVINGRLKSNMTPVEAALGFVRIGNETMARPVREISVSRGFDVRTHALVCFGGAAPQHACAVARILGMSRIVVHPLAGLLSAYGIAMGEHLRYATRSVMKVMSGELFGDLEGPFRALEVPLVRELERKSAFSGKTESRRFLDIRPLGTDTSISIPCRDYSSTIRTFRETYRNRFGFTPSDETPLELVNIRVEVTAGAAVFRESPIGSPGWSGQSMDLSAGTTGTKGYNEVSDGSDDCHATRPPAMVDTVRVHFSEVPVPTPIYRRERLAPGQQVPGPAIIVEDFSTIVVKPGFSTGVNEFGHLILERESIKGASITGKRIPVASFTGARIDGEVKTGKRIAGARIDSRRDPVMLEVFNHLFMSVAEQMGYTLANTAHSTNIKERLDFSCAIFDAGGNLVANAPHIPVHLGAMGESVKAIIAARKDSMTPGDTYVTNNPHNGGSHLPDITVISPVFEPAVARSSQADEPGVARLPQTDELGGIPSARAFEPGDARSARALEGRDDRASPVFFVASRGHHADIGGVTPGSMAPFAVSLAEEGIVIDDFLLVRHGRFREARLRELLLSSSFPARNIEERISDLRAQIAAGNTGIGELGRLVAKYGLATVISYMTHIRDNAAEAMREALGSFLEDGDPFESRFEDFLDDGSRIVVRLRIQRGDDPPHSHRALVDFTGTDPQVAGNLNAPLAVTKAAVIYVFRTLIDRDIPLNSGCLEPIEIRIPKGCLLYPAPDAAVVGGNVETSQRVVDVLLGALGVAAASQGTMNNFLFGRADGKGEQYYETIAGGSGATRNCDGASAVQVHMTNTRITDPEVLEHRFPEIRLERFAIRRGSGGKGRHRGGNGVIREVRFLEPRKVSILSERRRYAPYGVAGGRPGRKGRNILVRADGTRKSLGGKVERLIRAGERIIIETPGGGGFGESEA